MPNKTTSLKKALLISTAVIAPIAIITVGFAAAYFLIPGFAEISTTEPVGLNISLKTCDSPIFFNLSIIFSSRG